MQTGETKVIEVPSPLTQDGAVKISSSKSLISLGTERMLVDFGKANYISKARQQPEKVKQVLDKAKADGICQQLKL